MAHPCLGGEVNDAVKIMRRETGIDRRFVGNIGLHEVEGGAGAAGNPVDFRKTRLFQGGVVIGVEIVEPDDFNALFQQPASRVESDETSGAGHQIGLQGRSCRCL